MNAIEVRNVSKIYRLPQPVAGHTTLTALKGLNFSVSRGEYLGLIGANGAGKSTLLRLLAGTLLQSTGTITVHGTPLAFLQMGAGFNADLDLTENIRIYGAYIGRRDWLVEHTIDILDFAELTTVAELPFRDLSQGMQARLTLATIAHADPDIFLIDEALAVGDSHFRAVAIAHFLKLKRQRKTLILASHDLSVVKKLCDRVLVLDQGQLAALSPTIPALARYQKLMGSAQLPDTHTMIDLELP